MLAGAWGLGGLPLLWGFGAPLWPAIASCPSNKDAWWHLVQRVSDVGALMWHLRWPLVPRGHSLCRPLTSEMSVENSDTSFSSKPLVDVPGWVPSVTPSPCLRLFLQAPLSPDKASEALPRSLGSGEDWKGQSLPYSQMFAGPGGQQTQSAELWASLRYLLTHTEARRKRRKCRAAKSPLLLSSPGTLFSSPSRLFFPSLFILGKVLFSLKTPNVG